MNESHRTMDLARLTHGIVTLPTAAPAADIAISELSLDSRRVLPGTLFFALSGRNAHGLQYISEAIARGACAIFWEPACGVAPPPIPAHIFSLSVPNLSRFVGALADRFFESPSCALRIAGITGTNGKTTCAYLLAAGLEWLGLPAAYMGTLGAGPIRNVREGTHTTPDAVSVHRELADMRARNVRFVAMEVSSHALVQHRVDAVRFECAALTNLSRDHLDYHGTMAAYGAAKAALFEWPGLEHAVIHLGDDFSRALAARISDTLDVLAVWVGEQAHEAAASEQLFATHVRADAHGLGFDIEGTRGRAHAQASLMGRFNVENLVVVLGLLLAFDVPLAQAIEALAHGAAPPGRMQAVRSPGKPLAIVDYAHSPDALAKVLRAAREHARSQLWCVFGCGGERDTGKRALMGRIADELADRIIVTDDNPRGEPPEAITSEIHAAIRNRPVRVIHDRRRAIGTALSEASTEDVVLIAGKGHERYQIYGAQRLPFSDVEEVERAFGVAA